MALVVGGQNKAALVAGQVLDTFDLKRVRKPAADRQKDRPLEQVADCAGQWVKQPARSGRLAASLHCRGPINGMLRHSHLQLTSRITVEAAVRSAEVEDE